MLLLSIDASYNAQGKITETTRKRADSILEKSGIKWTSAFDAEGWVGVLHRFNVSGYGSIFVDADGIVRGLGIHAKDAEMLYKKYPSKERRP